MQYISLFCGECGINGVECGGEYGECGGEYRECGINGVELMLW